MPTNLGHRQITTHHHQYAFRQLPSDAGGYAPTWHVHFIEQGIHQHVGITLARVALAIRFPFGALRCQSLNCKGNRMDDDAV
jgi:hypothetical protein